MRLFHVSEESDIVNFIPLIPKRDDLDKSKGLVWALTDKCLPNFLTPRNCPRVAYHASEKTTPEDISKFFSSSSRHCVAVEHNWYERISQTSLYLYEFDTSNFYLQDEAAGYFVSEKTEIPIAKTKLDNLFFELFSRNVEVRILNYLWHLSELVKESTLNWSLCRMRNAKPNKHQKGTL